MGDDRSPGVALSDHSRATDHQTLCSSMHLLLNHIRVSLLRARRSHTRSWCVGAVLGPGDIMELLRRVRSSARQFARRSTAWTVTPATIETPPALRTVSSRPGWRAEAMWHFRKAMERVAKRAQRRDHKGQQRGKDRYCIHTRPPFTACHSQYREHSATRQIRTSCQHGIARTAPVTVRFASTVEQIVQPVSSRNIEIEQNPLVQLLIKADLVERFAR